MSLSYVFFGTPGFCTTVLDALQAAGRQPEAVVCQPDRPRGRGRKPEPVPTKAWAEAICVPVHQPGRCRKPDFMKCMCDMHLDLGLVFAFGQLLPEDLLTVPRLGFINIHPSLLPCYRGAAPVQWALINGDEETGVSIVRMTPRLDDGEILASRRVKIDALENAVELGQRLADVGAELVLEVMDGLENDAVEGRAQDEDGVVWAPALKKEDGRIDWHRPAVEIHNRIRGVQPWPGAHTRLRGKLLKIHRSAPAEGDGGRPGEVIAAGAGSIKVATGEGLLAILELQLEGKRRMDARAFLAGRSLAAGDVLGELD